jgi:hypothetical protein
VQFIQRIAKDLTLTYTGADVRNSGRGDARENVYRPAGGYKKLKKLFCTVCSLLTSCERKRSETPRPATKATVSPIFRGCVPNQTRRLIRKVGGAGQ